MTFIDFINIIKDNFFAVNPILLGTLTFIGYLALKRGFFDSLIGGFKTIIGVTILTIGAGTLVGMAKPIFNSVSKVFTGNVVPLDPYLGWTSSNNFLAQGISETANYVSWVSYALIIGFFINILLIIFKKFTNVHTLMVTGHVMFQQTAIMTVAIFLFMFATTGPGTREIGTILFTGLIMGVYWGVGSNSTFKGTEKVTNNAGFANGHQQMFTAAIAYKIGSKFGDAKDSAETKKMSSKFKMFEDNLFTQMLIILSLFSILILVIEFATPGQAGAFSKNIGTTFKAWQVSKGWWGTNIILGSLKLVGSLLVLTMGVRMFVTELQQAFQGVSEKIIPGSVVAVDTAATYGFAQNSVTYGFLSGVIGQFLAVFCILGISIATGGSMPVVIPLFITLFFNSGTIGAYANASGGYKAALLVPGIIGFVELFVASIAIKFIGSSYDALVASNAVISNFSPVKLGFIGMGDWNLIWGLHFILASFGQVFAWIVFVGSIVLMLFIAQITDNPKQTKQTFWQKRFNLKITNQKPITKTNNKE